MRVLFDQLECPGQTSRRDGHEVTSQGSRELDDPLNWLAHLAQEMGRLDENTFDREPLGASWSQPVDDPNVIGIAFVQRGDDHSGVEQDLAGSHPRRFRTACASAAEASRPAGTFELETLPNR